jgi:hypothetical protein
MGEFRAGRKYASHVYPDRSPTIVGGPTGATGSAGPTGPTGSSGGPPGPTVVGHGLLQLTAGDVITLHNRTNTGGEVVAVTSAPSGVEASTNRMLQLMRIA